MEHTMIQLCSSPVLCVSPPGGSIIISLSLSHRMMIPSFWSCEAAALKSGQNIQLNKGRGSAAAAIDNILLILISMDALRTDVLTIAYVFYHSLHAK